MLVMGKMSKLTLSMVLDGKLQSSMQSFLIMYFIMLLGFEGLSVNVFRVMEYFSSVSVVNIFLLLLQKFVYWFFSVLFVICLNS